MALARPRQDGARLLAPQPMAQRPEYWSELVSSTIAALEEMHEFGVCNIVREDRPATTPEAIEAWQKRFHPASLPLDVKSFLKSSDGLKVTWQVQHGGGDLLPLGAMRINALAEMTPVPPEALLNERGERCAELPAPLPGGTQAFDLDAQCSYGRVCLISTGGRGEHSAAQVWFQDLGCTWCFLANSFTDYVKLMLAHLGLPHWQYAFTESGIDPVAKHWFRFLAPERLAGTDCAVGTMLGSRASHPARPVAGHERSRANLASRSKLVRRRGSGSRKPPSARRAAGAGTQVDDE